jgi:hypothetical protein
MDVVKLVVEGDMERHFLPAAESRASWTVLFLRHKHRSIENTLPAAGRRFWKSAIGFPSHFGVSEITGSVSRLIFAFQKFHDRPRVV